MKTNHTSSDAQSSSCSENMESNLTQHILPLAHKKAKNNGNTLLVFDTGVQNKPLFLSVFDGIAKDMGVGQTYKFYTKKTDQGFENLHGSIVSVNKLPYHYEDTKFKSPNHPDVKKHKQTFKSQCLKISAESLGDKSSVIDELYADRLFKRAKVIYQWGLKVGYVEWIQKST